MHRRVAVIRDGVDIRAEPEEIVAGLDRLLVGAGLLFRGTRAETRRRHQRRATVHVRDRGIGAEFDQQFQERGVRRIRREHEGRATLAVDSPTAGGPAREAQVYVGAFRHELPDELLARHVAVVLGDRVAFILADVGLADPREDVERRIAGTQVVGVSPEIEQRRRDFKTAVLHRQRERTVAPLGQFVAGLGRRRDGVDVDAGFQQNAHRVQVPGADGKEQRVEPGGHRRRHLGLRGDERLDDCGVTFGGGPHERRLSARQFGIHLGPAGQKRAHDRDAARARGSHQRSLAAGDRAVRIGPGLEERVHGRAVAIGAGQRQRRDAVAIRGVGHGGIRRQQAPHERDVCGLDRAQKCLGSPHGNDRAPRSQARHRAGQKRRCPSG